MQKHERCDDIDWKLQPLIKELNTLGIETFFSCSGHHTPKALFDEGALPQLCRARVNGQYNTGDIPYLVMEFDYGSLCILTKHFETLRRCQRQTELKCDQLRYHKDKPRVITFYLYDYKDYYAPERFQLILRYLIFKLKRLKG